MRICWFTLFAVAAAIAATVGGPSAAAEDEKPIRAGVIGLDTSHAVEFTKVFNNPKAEGDLGAVEVVAAFSGGSPDIASSRDRIEGYTKTMRGMNVEICDSIPAMLAKVDVVLLESVDGRKHLEQAKPVFEAGKAVFIDKPLAASLKDALEIAELGNKHNVPWFSASALRFGKTVQGVRNDPKIGPIRGAIAWSPCPLEPTHGDLFWYGIHGVEELFTLMGPGCTSVTRTRTDGADVVTGVWNDGRVGTFRGIRDGKETYGGVVFGKNATADAGGFESYEPLVQQIATFFHTKQPPVGAEETLEIMAFMEAADESKRQE